MTDSFNNIIIINQPEVFTMANFMDNFNDNSEQSGFDAADVQKFKVQAVLPYLIPILFFLPIIGDKNSKFCKFHANQQLSWLIVAVVIGVLMKVLSLIPVLGAICCSLLSLATLVITVMLMISAAQGKAIRIPFIGSLISVF